MSSGGGIDWGGFGNRGGGADAAADGRNVYLTSIASFKAFNLPFSIVGRALEPKGQSSPSLHIIFLFKFVLTMWLCCFNRYSSGSAMGGLELGQGCC